MIEQKIHKLKISQAEAAKLVAYSNEDSIYDEGKGEFTFKANHASGKGFRLVYDDKKVLALIEGMDKTVTSTIYTVEEFATEKQALDRIKDLGLEYEPEEPLFVLGDKD